MQTTFAPAPVDPASPEVLTGDVKQTGQTYTATVSAFPDLTITSKYPGILRFGYDEKTKRTLVVYAAYESRVLEMGPIGADGHASLVADYSSRFGAQAFGGAGAGGLAVRPVVFSQDGAWWIFSGEGSTKPQLMKIQNGAVIDYAQTAFPSEGSLRAAPGPSPHEIYVEGDSRSYILTDNGFKQAKVQWESSKLNPMPGDVMVGEVVNADAGGASSGAVNYLLSNNGGETWIPVTPGQQIVFTDPSHDFRFKIMLSPATDLYATPWVDTITVEYWFRKSDL
jgi:hypothetical protein